MKLKKYLMTAGLIQHSYQKQFKSPIDISYQNVLIINERTQTHYIKYMDIRYCKADSNYTTIYLKDGKKYLVSKCLKAIASMIKSVHFIRVHASFLINKRYISKVNIDNQYSILLGDTEIPVSRANKKTIKSLVI